MKKDYTVTFYKYVPWTIYPKIFAFFFFMSFFDFDMNILFSKIASLVHIFVYSSVVLTCKLNGNETMDAITALYTEVIFLCYIIVYIVLDILLNIEQQFSTHYILDEDFVENRFFKPSAKTTLFNMIPIKYSSKGESTMDLAFLLFPTAVIFYIVVPTLGFLYNKDLNVEAMNSSFTIDVIGHQWYWSYAYNIDLLNNKLLVGFAYMNPTKLEFDSIIDMDATSNRLLSVDKVMVIPSHTNIRLSLTSTDVIHSWAIPQLGIKVDTMPGRITTCNLYTYSRSTFYGQCSELCGANHGFMPIVVESVHLGSFFDWYLEALSDDIVIPTYIDGMKVNDFEFNNINSKYSTEYCTLKKRK
jgi:cytochrome c oxidase subunit 2